MNITYYGHSCFTVEAEGYMIALDPYTDVKGYKPLSLNADEVLCSHDHFDHNYVEAVEVKAGSVNPFKITELQSYHDDKQGSLRGKNIIRIFEYDGLRLAHFGDIGCRPTDEQMQLLSGLDAALVPVGGTYTLDARQQKALMDELKPRIIIPMHYRISSFGFDVLEDLSDFTSLYDKVFMPGASSMIINHETPAGVYVLEFA